MNRLKKSIVTSVIGLALAGGSVVAAPPAMAASQIGWIWNATQNGCNIALTSAVRTVVAKGYTNIKSSGCYYLSTRKTWEAWYSYNT